MLGAAQAVFLGACPAVVPQVYDDHVDEFGATLHWPLDATGGTDFAERIVGGDTHDATGSGEIEYVDDTIAQRDPGGRCLGLGGGAGDSMLTVSSAALFDSTAGFWGCLIQPDVTDRKQQIINRPDSTAGGFALELLADGTLYAYRYDGTGTFREITSASGIVAAGEAAHIGMSWGAAGLRLFKNGSIVASEGTPTTNWAVSNTNDIHFGRWESGVDGFDGLIAHVVFRTTEPAAEEVAQIALPRGISLLTGADLGAIEENQTTTIDPRDHGHFKGAITPIVTTQGQDGTASVDGELVDYMAGDTADPAGDSFGITVTDDRGTSDEALFTIEVIEAVTGEYITTVEAQPSWNGDPSDAGAVVAAFADAITEANANAGSSSTGRGVIELVQGRTYIVETTNGGPVVGDLHGAVDINVPNVELRTQGKPSIASGKQAAIKFKDWASQTDVALRSIIRVVANNVTVGWLQLHGNKLSSGSTRSGRENWLSNSVDYSHGNGGIMNLAIFESDGVRIYEVESHSALVDGFYVNTRGSAITDLFAEDCDFHHNRRQGMTLFDCGSSSLTWDQVIFRRVKFRATGDEPDMPGESPGNNIDVEPTLKGRPWYGLTFFDCDFDDSRGASFEKGGPASSSGRGFAVDTQSHGNYFKLINCRSTNNKDEAFKINLRHDKDLDQALIEDIVASENGSNILHFDIAGAASGNQFTNVEIINADVGEIRFDNELEDNGHDVTIWKGDHDPTIETNGKQTIAVNDGFPM